MTNTLTGLATFRLASGDTYHGDVVAWVRDLVTMVDYSVSYEGGTELYESHPEDSVTFRTDAYTVVEWHGGTGDEYLRYSVVRGWETTRG